MSNSVDRPIWIFREERTGSTSFTNALHRLLKKPTKFVEYIEQIEYDSSVIMNMHHFDFLPLVKKEDNPIIFRCTRKNRFDQFLSFHTKELTNFCNIHDTNTEEVVKFESFVSNNKITLDYLSLFRFAVAKRKENLLWDAAASIFDNQVFYYEDFDNPVDIPLLNLYNVNIYEGQHTKKIPDYKETLYTNLDEVKKWMANFKPF